MGALQDLKAEQEAASAELKGFAVELKDVLTEKDRISKDLYERENQLRKKQARAGARQRAVTDALRRLRDLVPRSAVMEVESFGASVRQLEHKLNKAVLDRRARDLELTECKRRGMRQDQYTELLNHILEIKKHHDELVDQLEEAKRDLHDREVLVEELLEEPELKEAAAAELAKIKGETALGKA